MPDTIANAADAHRRFKRDHPEALLFIRTGEVYELLEEDALTAHRLLGLTLVHRGLTPMTGVRRDRLEDTIRRLIVAGYGVAVCEPADAHADAEAEADAENHR